MFRYRFSSLLDLRSKITWNRVPTLDSELRRRATRSEQRQHEAEKHPPRYCAEDDCLVEVGSGLYCEDHETARFVKALVDDYIGGTR